VAKMPCIADKVFACAW